MFTIFAMSANTSSEDISNAINSGMNGHLDKPMLGSGENHQKVSVGNSQF